MIINVFDLSRKTTSRQLIKVFQTHGKVKTCDIIKDQNTGESKGFGFVEMINEEEAASAIKNIHGTKFDGHKIRVKASSKA
ncbi:MAG: RNA recognition motif-containing protein [Rickettsiales bacterium]|jgi:RNA recognition motif-containing protein